MVFLPRVTKEKKKNNKTGKERPWCVFLLKLKK